MGDKVKLLRLSEDIHMNFKTHLFIIHPNVQEIVIRSGHHGTQHRELRLIM